MQNLRQISLRWPVDAVSSVQSLGSGADRESLPNLHCRLTVTLKHQIISKSFPGFSRHFFGRKFFSKLTACGVSCVPHPRLVFFWALPKGSSKVCSPVRKGDIMASDLRGWSHRVTNRIYSAYASRNALRERIMRNRNFCEWHFWSWLK